jgi:hypothetical protein
MGTQEICMGVVVALICIIFSYYALGASRRARSVRIAGASLLAEIRAMLFVCEEIAKLSPEATASCAGLQRGLAKFSTVVEPTLEECRTLYMNLSPPTAMAAAAAAYTKAAASAQPPLAANLLLAGRQLRRVVNGIHRLGAAADLE